MGWWSDLRAVLGDRITLSDVRGPSGGRRLFWLVALWVREAASAARSSDLATLAGALTYKTLLSLIPALAVALAVVSSVENGRYAEQLIAYLRDQFPEGPLTGAIDTIQELARNAWAVAGGGALFFLWTVLTLLTTVENAFVRVWQTGRGRSWRRRLPLYVTIAVLVPPLLSLSVWTQSRLAELASDGLPWMARAVGVVSAWILTVAGMTALYCLMPATKVRKRAACWGGLLAGTMLELAKWGFRIYGSWAAGGRQSAVYGPLLALPLLLLWLWWVWIIVLGGGQFAFVVQHFRGLATRRDLLRTGAAWRPRAAAWALRLASDALRRGVDPARMDEKMAEAAGLSSEQASSVLEELAEAGVLYRLRDKPDAYLPRAESSALSLADAALAVRDAPLHVPDDAGHPFDRWLAGRFAAAREAERQALSVPSWPEALASTEAQAPAEQAGAAGSMRKNQGAAERMANESAE